MDTNKKKVDSKCYAVPGPLQRAAEQRAEQIRRTGKDMNWRRVIRAILEEALKPQE